jgi:zinc finger HIT domain-containing protein 3
VALLCQPIILSLSIGITANPCADPGATRTPPVLDEKQTVPRVATAQLRDPEEEDISDAPVLKPLTSLKWPYIPEEPSYTDPLERNKPKPLQLHHYQSIGPR